MERQFNFAEAKSAQGLRRISGRQLRILSLSVIDLGPEAVPEKGETALSGWKRDMRAGVLALLALMISVVPWTVFIAVCANRQNRAAAAAAMKTVNGPYVALTFDDGPRLDTTPVLLDGLAQRGVHATFFIVGQRAEAGQDILKRMVEEGHQIGLHTDTHKMLTELNAAGIYREIGGVRDTLTALVGDLDFMLRPPYGKVNSTVCAAAEGPIILWSIDPEDWSDHDTARQVAHIVERAQDGDIILLHDIYASSVETALQVVDELMARGFYFVTVEELFAVRGVQPEDGQIYRKLPPED